MDRPRTSLGKLASPSSAGAVSETAAITPCRDHGGLRRLNWRYGRRGGIVGAISEKEPAILRLALLVALWGALCMLNTAAANLDIWIKVAAKPEKAETTVVVSVTMDTVAQIQGHLLAHQYEGLVKKTKLRGARR